MPHRHAPQMDGRAITARINALAAITAEPPGLTRVFASPEQLRASALVLGWMRDAGMAVHTDAIGNVVGRYEGATPGAPALLLGSHLDSVRDAGRWDGPLGVVCAIACVEALHLEQRRLPYAIEVIGFADEEGTRFGATMLGSRALTGRFDPLLLERPDDAGITMAEALRSIGLDPAAIAGAARPAAEIAAYLELHIEQGPVLEQRDLPVGCVIAIDGQTRLSVTLHGMAGHAGTVPMGGRRQDALAAAAACILAIEELAGREDGAVATVGRLEAWPGAVNVIAGRVTFSVDVRAPEDPQRLRLVAAIRAAILRIGTNRGVRAAIEQTHELPASPCDPALRRRIAAAIAAEGHEVIDLPSGAGHDAMALAQLVPIGMIFVRCRNGISHHPDEHVATADAEAGARVLHRVLLGFAETTP